MSLVNKMREVKYFCEGGCAGSVSENEFKEGKNKCATHGCPDFGKPLLRKEKCPDCEKWIKEEEHCDCAAEKETPGFL